MTASATVRTLVLVVIVLMAGCSGVFASDQSTETRPEQFRLVIQNDADTTQPIRLTLTDANGTTVLNEKKTLEPGGGWVVGTFNVPALQTPVTITARLPAQDYTNELRPIRNSQRGAALHTITDDGLNHYHCHANVTCWQDHR